MPSKSAPSLQALVTKAAKHYQQHVPAMVDEDTRLDSVSPAESELKFNCSFVRASNTEFEPRIFQAMLEQGLRNEANRTPMLKQILSAGGTLVYSYKDLDDVPFLTIKIQPRQPAEIPLTDSPLNAAEKLFQRYVELEQEFDPAVVDLYSDDAKITNERLFPDGSTRLLSMPAPAYKQLIRSSLPLARSRGDANVYFDIDFQALGDQIQITATRFSELKKYSSPLALRVAKRSGAWLIVEEHSHSKAA